MKRLPELSTTNHSSESYFVMLRIIGVCPSKYVIHEM
ncbi:MAG: hypothetical protein RLZZ519_3514, partial [Bacteroidota bacterium]